MLKYLLCLLMLNSCMLSLNAKDLPLQSDKYKAAAEYSLKFFDAYDPWEPFNRHMYRFNRILDDDLLEPMVSGYQFITPDFIEKGVHNFFSNISELPVLANSILQVKGKKIVGTGGRLLLNTTLGVVGLWDPATVWFEMLKYSEDFGQTLGYYGVPEGPYVILPLLGPSNCRDSIGYGVDSFTLSLLYPTSTAFGTKAAVGTLKGIDTRAHVTIAYGDFDSMFEYEKVRALYIKSRVLLVNDAKLTQPVKSTSDDL